MANITSRAGGGTSAATPLLAASEEAAKTRKTRKLLLLVATIAIFLVVILSLNLTTTNILDPTQLCSTSPDPSSCHAIVAANSYPHSTINIARSIIASSLEHLDPAILVTEGMDPIGGIPAVADCVHLLGLSRDRLLASAASLAAGARSDARTFLSAAMTFHDTCLDGLLHSNLEIEARLKKVQDMISATLAVVSSATPSQEKLITRTFIRVPSWLADGDRMLLEGPVMADAVVAADGSGKFSTVQAAIDAAPSKSSSRYVIYVKMGTYKEMVSVAKGKSNIMIIGDGAGATVITGSQNVVDGSTTFDSATLASDAEGLILQDLTVQNTAGPSKGQAVALRVSGDRSVINRCSLEGYQDTLYSHALRQFYRDSTISGTVDFIFGNSAAVFQNCTIIARRPLSGQSNPITAQGRSDPNQNTGTSIQNCQVIPSSDLAPVKTSVPTYLGRPWKQYSRTVYMQSFIDDHVAAKGWLEWGGTFTLDMLYYGEYANTGPGAGTTARVKWPGYHNITTASDAMAFTVGQLIQGGAWLPSTGVPYKEGL